MEEEFLCPLCLNLFVDPVLLVCSHNLCSQCADNLFKFEKARGQRNEGVVRINCPLCRTPTDLPQDAGVAALQKNLIARSAVERIVERNRGGRTCDFCEKEPAIYSCDSCKGVVIGQKCADATHKKEAFRTHILSPLKENDQSRDPSAPSIIRHEGCQLHRGHPLELFCLDCSLPVCPMCLLVGTHRNAESNVPHRCIGVEVAAKDAAAELVSMADGAHARTVALKMSVEAIENTLQTVQQGFERAVGGVRTDFARLRQALDQHENALLQKATDIRTTKVSKLETQKQLMVATAERLGSEALSARQLANQRDALLLLKSRNTLSQRLREIEQVASPAEPCDNGVILYRRIDNVIDTVEQTAAILVDEALPAPIPAPEVIMIDDLPPPTPHTQTHQMNNQMNRQMMDQSAAAPFTTPLSPPRPNPSFIVSVTRSPPPGPQQPSAFTSSFQNSIFGTAPTHRHPIARTLNYNNPMPPMSNNSNSNNQSNNPMSSFVSNNSNQSQNPMSMLNNNNNNSSNPMSNYSHQPNPMSMSNNINSQSNNSTSHHQQIMPMSINNNQSNHPMSPMRSSNPFMPPIMSAVVVVPSSPYRQELVVPPTFVPASADKWKPRK